jgi:arsenate reductase (glutaredoxin)
MTTLYGITNCDTVKKARAWLENNGIEYTFWDYKKQGIDAVHLNKWCDLLGWEKVLNRAGMMWRKSPDEAKSKVVNQETAINFILTTPTAIKRPIVESNNHILIGFVEAVYREKLLKDY